MLKYWALCEMILSRQQRLQHTHTQIMNQETSSSATPSIDTMEFASPEVILAIHSFRVVWRLLGTAHRRSQVPVRSLLVHRIGNYSRVWGSRLSRSFARVLDEQGRSYAKQRDGETHVQHSNTDKCTKSDRKLLQCSRTATRSILIYHLFFIYRWESRGHRITGASAMEPPSVLVTSLSITLAQGGPMPQQS